MCEYRKINWRRSRVSFLYMVSLDILVFFFFFAFSGRLPDIVEGVKVNAESLYKGKTLKAKFYCGFRYKKRNMNNQVPQNFYQS